MTCPQLPPELITQIISHLHHDNRALAACSTVCRAWTYTARCYLFASPRALMQQDIDDLLCSKSVAIPFVRQLRLLGPLSWNGIIPRVVRAGFKFEMITSLSLTAFYSTYAVARSMFISHFAAIARLALHACTFQDLPDFVHFISSFPRLESLVVTNIQIAVGPGPPAPPSHLTPPPHLRHLEWRSFYTTPVLNWFTSSHTRPALRTFHVRGKDMRHLDAINAFLPTMDLSLEEFSFVTSVYVGAPSITSFSSSFLRA